MKEMNDNRVLRKMFLSEEFSMATPRSTQMYTDWGMSVLDNGTAVVPVMGVLGDWMPYSYITGMIEKALKNDKITIKVDKLKNKKISSMITLSEETRRMQDMMKMYSMPGMDMGAFGGEGETLILNANHPLVQYVIEHKDGENVEMICEQLYDLAKLQHAPLAPEAMPKLVARSNEIMMLLTK